MEAKRVPDMTIERSSTADKVAEALRTSILGGDLEAGTPLSDLSLAERMGVSRNTVREGMRRLVAEGLLQHRTHRGVMVAAATLDDVREIYDIRRRLEMAAVQAGNRALAVKLDQVLDELAGPLHDGDMARVVAVDIQFHQTLVDSLGNERLSLFFGRTLAELRLAWFRLDVGAEEAGAWVPSHRQVVSLLSAGRGRAAANLLERYLASAEAELTASMR